ncbi:unnamed protein product [Closterium sp. NIES-54]
MLPPPASSLPAVPDPESDLARIASPTVPHLLATVVTDPSIESTSASALVAELIDFAAACRLDYATSLVAESESNCPPSVGGRPGCTRHPDPALLRGGDRGSLLLLVADSHGRRDGASRVARHTEDYTCGSWVCSFDCWPVAVSTHRHLAATDDLVFATTDTEALTLVKSDLQKRHTCTDLGELRSYLGLQITRDRARCTITLTQSHMVHQVLQRFGFRYSSPQSTPLPTGHSLSAPPSDESVELVGCLITSGMGLELGGRGPVVLTGHAEASWVDDLAMQRSSQGYTFSLGSSSVSWQSTRSSSVLSSSCEAEIYAGAMAAHELRWLTYLLIDLGERPRSSPVLYVNNKAMIALYLEHRLEHRTNHIAVCYLIA